MRTFWLDWIDRLGYLPNHWRYVAGWLLGFSVMCEAYLLFLTMIGVSYNRGGKLEVVGFLLVIAFSGSVGSIIVGKKIPFAKFEALLFQFLLILVITQTLIVSQSVSCFESRKIEILTDPGEIVGIETNNMFLATLENMPMVGALVTVYPSKFRGELEASGYNVLAVCYSSQQDMVDAVNETMRKVYTYVSDPTGSFGFPFIPYTILG